MLIHIAEVATCQPRHLKEKQMIKATVIFIIGCSLTILLTPQKKAEATGCTSHPFTIEYHTDYSRIDDIGMEKLSLSDINEILE